MYIHIYKYVYIYTYYMYTKYIPCLPNIYIYRYIQQCVYINIFEMIRVICLFDSSNLFG